MSVCGCVSSGTGATEWSKIDESSGPVWTSAILQHQDIFSMCVYERVWRRERERERERWDGVRVKEFREVKRACRDTLQYTALLMLTLYSLSLLVSLTSHFSDGVSSCSFNPVYAGYLYHQCSSKSPWWDFQTTAAKRILASSSPLLSPHLSFPPPLSFFALHSTPHVPPLFSVEHQCTTGS